MDICDGVTSDHQSSFVVQGFVFLILFLMNAQKKKRKSKKSKIDEDVVEAFKVYAEDDMLDCDGLQQALAALGISTTKKDVKSFLKGSKTVDLEAFALIQEECNSKRSINDELEEAFDMFDEESRGFITQGDIQRVAKELGEEVL